MGFADIVRGAPRSDEQQPVVDHAAAAIAAAETKPAAPVAAPSSPAVPTGEPAADAAGAVGATPGTDSNAVQGLTSALKEERRKRQQYESELAEVRRQAGQQSAPATPAQPQEPEWNESVLEDLPGAFKKVEQRFNQRLEAELTRQRYAQSEAAAQQFIPDYAQVMEGYSELTQANPYIARMVHDAPSPAIAAYQAMKQWNAAKANNPQAIETRIRGESQTRIQQLEAEIAQLRSLTAAGSVPTSLTSARGSGASAPSAQDEIPDDVPLSSVLRQRKRA